MTLYLVEKALKMKIPLKVVKKDTKDVSNPLYNMDKIYDRSIMNAKIGKDDYADINDRALHIVQLTREWIKKPFKLDPIPLSIPLQATTRLARDKGAKIIVPTFPTQSLVGLEIVYQHEREVEYFKAYKRKNKRKRVKKG